MSAEKKQFLGLSTQEIRSIYLANNIQIVGEMRFGTKDALVKGLPIPSSFTKQLKIMEKNNVPIVKSLHT